jgi:hypothetical protein
MKLRIPAPRITDRGLAYTLALLLGAAVWLMGQLSSFTNLSQYAADHGFPAGYALPIGLDAAIPALLILDWLRPSPFLRGAAWTLALSTVLANGSVAHGDYRDRLLHALMPALAIIIVEAARHIRGSSTRMDRIRLSRWLLSPIRTFRLWRRMVLWEITSYAEALGRESAILHARTLLAAHYGKPSWRRTRREVPLTLRHMLATGQIPESVLTSPDVQTAVRDWVSEMLHESTLQAPAVLTEIAGTDEDQTQDPEPENDDPWDLIWDLQDSLRPRGVSEDVFAAAIGIARRQFEQVGTQITNEDLRVRLKIAKPQANAIGKVLRSSFESPSDLQDRTQDSPPAEPAAPEAVEPPPSPAPNTPGPAGLEWRSNGVLVASGSVSPWPGESS